MKTILATLGLVAIACSGSAQGNKPQAPTDVVATVGTTSITLAEVDEVALRQSSSQFGSARLGQALYLARSAALDDMIGNRLIDLEAKAQGVERAALVEREIASKVSPPTEEEIAAWYKANPGQVQKATLDQVRTPIRALLSEERMGAARARFINTVKNRTRVSVNLEPPRQEVRTAGRPARGPEGAPVEIIEFSDFQCPFCQRARPTVEQVMKTYGDRVRLVYRHYPLRNHLNARPAAEAASCAAEQGKFWQYHDQLFDNSSKLSDNDLKQHAAAIGLDRDKFNACFDQKKFKKDVDEDIAEADEAGVSGTPAFFINGRSLDGAQPLEAFKRIIDEELELKRR
jgi:protein-disulfide isomerase